MAGHKTKYCPRSLITDEIKTEMYEKHFSEGFTAKDLFEWLRDERKIEYNTRSIQTLLETEKVLRNSVAREVLKERIEVNVGAELEKMSAELAYWRKKGVERHAKLNTEEEKQKKQNAYIWEAIYQHNKLRDIFFKAATGISTTKDFNIDEFAEAVKAKILKEDK